MGTSSGPTPADLTPRAERLAKLRARKRDLETLLAAKNDLLKRLCAKEVALAGSLVPDAPSPSSATSTNQQQQQQQAQYQSQQQQQQQQPTIPHHGRHKDSVPAPLRKQLSHRLSSPSTSNAGSHPPPPPPHAAHNVHSRHHTVTTEHITKMYYSSRHPETQHFSRLHETHFSSSHPDIAAHHTHALSSQERQSTDTLPLLYQYASQLKARSPHLSGLPHVASSHQPKKRESSRRNTLQRTQTYHLTSHSDYNNYLESVPGVVSQTTSHKHIQTFTETPMMVPNTKRSYADQYGGQSNHNYHNMQLSPPSISSSQHINFINAYSHNLDGQDQKVKEKEWYESSLDSPSNANVGMNLSRESYGSLKKPLQRSPSVSQPRSSPDSNFNINLETHSVMLSPTNSQGMLSPTDSQGLLSLTGSQGVLSAASSQGVLSSMGSQVLSPLSSQSVLSSMGSQGVLSPMGSQGVLNSMGSQGVLNSMGSQGVLNSMGSQGVLSSVGSQGVLSPTGSQGALSPRSQVSSDVPFESPKNCTVVESGKWIPYREVSKPFEMSDFYKYSTKFRQNNNGNVKPKVVPCNPSSSVHMQPEELQKQHTQELWKNQY